MFLDILFILQPLMVFINAIVFKYLLCDQCWSCIQASIMHLMSIMLCTSVQKNDNAHMSRHLIRNVTELLLEQLELKTTNPKRILNSKNLKEKCKWIKKEIIRAMA